MQMIVCTRCNLILMAVDSRTISFDRSYFEGEMYEYADGGYDCEHDMYICPNCDGCDTSKDGYDMTLEHRELPISSGDALLALWEKRKEENPPPEYDPKKPCHTYIYEYGLPLDDPDLKAEIIEAELSNA